MRRKNGRKAYGDEIYGCFFLDVLHHEEIAICYARVSGEDRD